jgi:hypothetical protein
MAAFTLIIRLSGSMNTIESARKNSGFKIYEALMNISKDLHAMSKGNACHIDENFSNTQAFCLALKLVEHCRFL